MVTVETAIGIAALVAVLALLIGAVNVVQGQAGLCQAVREGARSASVGSSAVAATTQSFPKAFNVTEDFADGWVTVSGSAKALEFGVLHCSATTLLEPGVKPQ